MRKYIIPATEVHAFNCVSVLCASGATPTPANTVGVSSDPISDVIGE
ncbi:MAG: hypothetical protein IJ249_05735 [Paludibacteraceae bacterium]|nr:hypothetical protein [Paludibacteraceae bacterium]